MELKEPYKSLKNYSDLQSRIAPYIVVALLIIVIPIIVYDYFNLFRFHKDRVKVFCNSKEDKRIGVTHEMDIEALRLFYNDPSEFEKLSAKNKQSFYNSIFKLDTCQEGYLISTISQETKKLKFIYESSQGNETVYILAKFIEENPKERN